MVKIYLASSWRNEKQPAWVEMLRAHGHEVYDFRNPPHGRGGFAWSDIDPDWKSWTHKQYIEALENPVAVAGFQSDFDAMKWCDACICLLPCGRSAHLELGWAVGAGKWTIMVTQDGEEPELMPLMCDAIVGSGAEALAMLSKWEEGGAFSEPQTLPF